MLENIKKKINNALKESIHITENISTQFSRVNSPTLDTSSDHELGIPPEINIAAGSELLQKYEDAWRNTYEANKANVEVAKNITETIDRLQQRMQARQVNMNDLMTCLAGLPAIEENLKASLDKFNEIESLGIELEEKIADLSDVTKMLDEQEQIMKNNLEAKRMEMVELEAEQLKKAEEQKLKIQHEEDKLKRLQQERQAAFDDAFQSDMQVYKQTGAVTKIELKGARVMTLEEIDLDNDGTMNDLEDFLND
ncbi:dysbindin protein homolog [Episyrphus balteatus]|uniref:dysbindin protein homolog n=1 Tax=Episyrphus balteatus TaxID=286459 RepID=UPI00248514E1|nr:dysbindin protein homolog [Episyrphus balteatus]